jgi:predicted DNA-binding transcriptional regulator YafY
MSTLDSRRLVAERVRRIWMLVEEIAAHPGHSRAEIAAMLHLSERQVQADLNVIRTDMRLPLVRRQGYRFAEEGRPTGGPSAFTLREAHVLVLLVREAMRDRSVDRAALDALAAKLPALCPPHLQPLVDRMLATWTPGRAGVRQQEVFAALGDALLRGAWVQLHYPPDDISSPIRAPIVQPELLVPYLSSWFVIGECRQRNRVTMLNLDAVHAVTLAEVVEVHREA